MSQISVTIDRLVLRGFELADGEAVAEGIRSELSRLLSDPTTRLELVRSQRTPVLRLPVLSETGTSGRRTFGAGVARQIRTRIN